MIAGSVSTAVGACCDQSASCAEELLALQTHGDVHERRRDLSHRPWTFRDQLFQQARNGRIAGRHRGFFWSRNIDASGLTALHFMNLS